MTKEAPKFILASSSPRRKEILSKMGIEFEVVPSDFNENTIFERTPEKLVKKLSQEKANCVHDDSAFVSRRPSGLRKTIN